MSFCEDAVAKDVRLTYFWATFHVKLAPLSLREWNETQWRKKKIVEMSEDHPYVL